MVPPIELGKKDFSRTVRGYSTQEVDDHLRFMMEKYTALYHECEALEARMKELEAENNMLKNGEDAVRESLLNAQKASGKIIENARERADIIVRSTKRICDNIIADYQAKREAQKNALLEMKHKMDEFHDKSIDALDRQAATMDRLLISIPGLDELLAEEDTDVDLLMTEISKEVQAENEAYERKLALEAEEQDRREREKAERAAAEAAEAEAKLKAEFEERAKAEVEAAYEKQRAEEEEQEKAMSENNDEFSDLLFDDGEEDSANEPEEKAAPVSADGTKVFNKVTEETEENKE